MTPYPAKQVLEELILSGATEDTIPACLIWAALDLPEPGPVVTVWDLMEWQGGMCGACGLAPLLTDRRADAPRTGLFLDHAHATGEVRGWLCTACNSIEGRPQHCHEPARSLLLTYRFVFPALIAGMPPTPYRTGQKQAAKCPPRWNMRDARRAGYGWAAE